MNRIIIVADFGAVRAFRLQADPLQDKHRWHATELEVPALEVVPGKIHEEVSDQAGEFARGNDPRMAGGMSLGEEHNSETEHEKRLIRKLARHISEIVIREDPQEWDLAAPQPICKRLQAELDPRVRARLKTTEGADLTKASIEEIEERFVPLRHS